MSLIYNGVNALNYAALTKAKLFEMKRSKVIDVEAMKEEERKFHHVDVKEESIEFLYDTEDDDDPFDEVGEQTKQIRKENHEKLKKEIAEHRRKTAEDLKK